MRKKELDQLWEYSRVLKQGVDALGNSWELIKESAKEDFAEKDEVLALIQEGKGLALEAYWKFWTYLNEKTKE